MTVTQGLRSLLPGPGNTAGVDGGAVSGVSEVLANSLDTTAIAAKVLQYAAVSVTAAEINAMYVTPKLLVAAPAAGRLIVPQRWLWSLTAGTQFASGGVVQIQYGNTGSGGGSAIGNTLAANQVTSATSLDNLVLLGSSNLVLTAGVATGLYLSNQTGSFTTGTGTAIVHIWYSVNLA